MEIKEFELFFNDQYVPVLRYCHTIVKDMSAAEDIVQQAFAGIWQKKDTAIIISVKAYLYKSVYHASLDFLKHEKIKMKYRLANNNKIPPVVENMSGQKELQARIVEAIDSLPPLCGQIFRMNRLEQMKYHEIAEALDIPPKKVENQIGKALKILREALKDYLPLLII